MKTILKEIKNSYLKSKNNQKLQKNNLTCNKKKWKFLNNNQNLWTMKNVKFKNKKIAMKIMFLKRKELMNYNNRWKTMSNMKR